MSCRKWERWISDAQDGELSLRRQRHLKLHFGTCPACRIYAARLRVLHAQSEGLEDEPVSAQQARDMLARLKERLRAEAEAERAPARPYPVFRDRRAWIAAGALAAAAVLVLLVLPPQKAGLRDEGIAFSIDETLAQVFAEIGDDPELERAFNSLLASSLRGIMESSPGGIGPGHYDSPLFWQDLTEEELRFLENEIKKEMKS